MRKQLLRIVLATPIVCILLAPALIWSGRGPHSSNESTAPTDEGAFKSPPFFIIGPPMTAEELAAREQEKFLSILEAQVKERDNLASTGRFLTPGAETPAEAVVFQKTGRPPVTYDQGLTPAELEKLAAIRSGAWKPRGNPGVWEPKDDPQPLEYDAPLRPLGFEGLSPAERAKLEASRARDKNATGDEGGRSR